MKKEDRIDTGKAFSLLWRYLAMQKGKIGAGVMATIMIGVMELLTGAFLKFLTNTVTKIEGVRAGGEELKIPVKLNLDLDLIGQKLGIIDRVLKGPAEIFRGILIISLVFFMLYLLQALFQYAREVYMNLAIERVLQKFKSDIFRTILGAPVRFFSRNATGDLISRVTYDAAVLTDTINILIEISRTFIYIVMFVPVMFFINSRFALFTVIFFPASFIIIRYIARIIKRSSKDVSDNVGDYTAFMEERINRQRLIKTTVNEKTEQGRFDDLVEKNYQYRRKLILQRFFLKPSNELMGMMVLAVLFIFFSKHLLAGESNIGDVAFFLYLVKECFKPVKKVAQAVGDLNMALISTGKIERLFETEQERSGSEQILGDKVINELEVRNLDFSYNGKPVISGLSLKLSRGERVIITGETGAGKSTLCSLLCLLNEPSPGSVMLNGTDINKFPLSEVRRKVVLVTGDMPLIPGSIISNLFYGNNGTPDDLERYRRILPGSVFTSPDTVINGSETILTSGEARKIALVRAFLSQPSVLLLDEAFSYLDEDDIRQAIDLIPAGTITIIVSRNRVVLESGSMIMVMKDGKLTPST